MGSRDHFDCSVGHHSEVLQIVFSKRHSESVAIEVRLRQINYSLRTYRPESATTWEYLPPESSAQLDSGTCGTGQKTHLDCDQFDCTCGIVAMSSPLRSM